VKFAFFVHSLASDWNHGNAHFVRGVLSELLRRGHEVLAFEQTDNWSRFHLERDHGPGAVRAFLEAYPEHGDVARTYTLSDGGDVEAALDLDRTLAGVDVVVVHEWTPPAVVAALGERRRTRGGFTLLFHDTHHRIVSEPAEMAQFDLTHYDGVLAFGQILADKYAAAGWENRVWTWHEAADPHVFHPIDAEQDEDFIWVGNWGDGERTAQLHEFLLDPVRDLGLRATVHGVRYPDAAKQALAECGIAYGGYLPNHHAPRQFARRRVTVHVPRQFYVTDLPGIPTIRVFEALACGIPLICSPWPDTEHLFMPGDDFLTVTTGDEMKSTLRRVIDDPSHAAQVAEHGRQTVLARHTCGHRVDELLQVLDDARRWRA
jgi:spore maturation protein CgeB